MTHTQEFKMVSHQMELILEVGRAINAVIEVDKLLDLIANRTAELLDADRCSIFVADHDRQVLWTQAAMGSERIEIPIDAGLAGAVATTGEIINVPNAYEDERFNPEVDRKTGYQTKNLITGPMFNSSGEVIGVFQLLNSNAGAFSGVDEELLKALAGFAGNALENALLYDELKNTFYSVLEVLAATVDAKHPYTAGHTARVAQYSCGIAEVMGLSDEEIEILRVSAYLHDYGKIAIRDSVLTKPGRLTEEEYGVMKEHAAKSKEILSKMYWSRDNRQVPSIAGAHHERYDGNGYPNGLKGDEIPLGARIMALADVFDALTSDRDYREALPFETAMDIIRKDVGKAFDPDVFKYFELFYQEFFA